MSNRAHQHNSSQAWRRRLCMRLATAGLAMGLTSSSLAVSFARTRVNVQELSAFTDGHPGSLVVVGNLGTGLVWPLHEAFNGRVLPIWLNANDVPTSLPFQQFLPPGANGEASKARGLFYTAHETAAASAMAGNWDPITNIDPSASIRSVIGFAPEASLILSAGFAGGISDNGVLIAKSSLSQAFALFAMVDPKIAGFAAGMLGIAPYPVATVVNASFGSVANTKDRTGESILAHAFDAAVWRTDAIVVTAVGDDRRNPALINMINTDPMDPGGTAGSPGTAYNVLNVARLNRGLGGPDDNSSDGPVGVTDWRSAGITLISTVDQISLPMGCTITSSLPESLARTRSVVGIAAPGTVLTLAGSPAFDGRYFSPAATDQQFTSPDTITLLPGDETNKAFFAVGPYTLTGSFVDQQITAGTFTLAGANQSQLTTQPGPFSLAGGASQSMFTSAGASGGTLGTMFSYNFTYNEPVSDPSRASDMQITVSDGVTTITIGGRDNPGITPGYGQLDGNGNPTDGGPGFYTATIDLSAFNLDGNSLTITVTNDLAADPNPNDITNFSVFLDGIYTLAGPTAAQPATLFTSGGASAGTLGMFTYNFNYNEPTSDPSLASDMRIVISDGTNTAVIGGDNFAGIAPSYNGTGSDASGNYGDAIDLSAFSIDGTTMTITVTNDRGGDPNPNAISNFTATLGGIFDNGGASTTIFDNNTNTSMAGAVSTFTYSFDYDEPILDASRASDIRIVLSDGANTAVIGGLNFPGIIPIYDPDHPSNVIDDSGPGTYSDSIDVSAIPLDGRTLTVSIANDSGTDLNPDVVSNFQATLGGVRDGILFTGGNGATGTLGVFTYSFTYAEPLLDGSLASDMKITITDGNNTATIGGANSPGVAPSYQGAASDAPGNYGDSVDLSSFLIDGSTLTISIANDNVADVSPNVITNFAATLSGVNTAETNPDVNPTDPTAAVTRSFVPLWEGTSFASAIIAGAAALVQDVGLKNDLWLPEYIPLTDAQGSPVLDSRGSNIFVPKPLLDGQGAPMSDSSGNPLFKLKPSGLVTRAMLINSVDQTIANVQQAQSQPGPEQDACITTNPLDRQVGSGLIDFRRLKTQLLSNQVRDVRPDGLGGANLLTPFPYLVDGLNRTLNGITRGSYHPTLDDPTDVIRRDPPPFDPADLLIQQGGNTPALVSEDIPQVLPAAPLPGVTQGWFRGWGDPITAPGAGTTVTPVVGPTPNDGPVIAKGTDPRKPFVTTASAPIEGSGFAGVMAPPETPKSKNDTTVFPQAAHTFQEAPSTGKKSEYRPYGQPQQIIPPDDPGLRTDRFNLDNVPTTGQIPGPMSGPGSGAGGSTGSNAKPINAGWDHGRLGVGRIDYPIGIITPNSTIRATLVWNRTEIWNENMLNLWASPASIQPLQERQLRPLMSLPANDPTGSFPTPSLSTNGRELPTIQSAFAFENLDLEIYRVNPNPGPPPGLQNFLVGASRSVWGTVEHVSVGPTPALCRPRNNSDILFGEYFIRVKYVDTMFDLGGYRYCGGFQTLQMISDGNINDPNGAYKNVFPGETEFAVVWTVDLANSPGISFVQAIEENPRDFNNDGLIDGDDVSALLASSLGDMNNDGVIGAGDVSILLSNFGSDDIAYDLNFDGVVNSGDLAEMLARYGETPTP